MTRFSIANFKPGEAMDFFTSRCEVIDTGKHWQLHTSRSNGCFDLKMRGDIRVCSSNVSFPQGTLVAGAIEA